eukprot:TRINITY_DN1204_c0_g1_i1.p1 TRINITY_DN1204_c0_g1~~TRINITY_DN1204_c0_g1_i1.p1  ORF type:complete len:354 (-),score=64.68 TRINITY_DN1204_c0_g1_i1:44-1105(-)
MSNTNKVNLAIIGAGLFAQKAHASSLSELSSYYNVVAVYSRSKESVEALLKKLTNYKDVSVYHGDQLEQLLERKDIEAVDIVLPIGDVTTNAIRASLKAGKHVLSEKPLAASVKEGRMLVKEYEDNYSKKVIWEVAENFYHMDAYIKASEILKKGELGKPLFIEYVAKSSVTEDNAYYQTKWRKEPNYQGGFFLDGGIHHVAALQMVLGDIEEVTAFSAQHKAHLPPLDTISTALKFKNGALGIFLISFGSNSVSSDPLMTITCEKSTLLVTKDSIEIKSVSEQNKTETQKITVESSLVSVRNELESFAKLIRGNSQERLYSAKKALSDLTVLEAIVKSAEERKVVPICNFEA